MCDSLYDKDKLIGTITSGGYGHRVKKNIAFAFVQPDYATVGTKLQIELLGQRYNVTLCDECLYDPNNELVKG